MHTELGRARLIQLERQPIERLALLEQPGTNDFIGPAFGNRALDDIRVEVPQPGRTLRAPEQRTESLVRSAVSSAPEGARLLYLFSLVTGLKAAALSELTGVPELTVRQARTLVSARIHEALTT